MSDQPLLRPEEVASVLGAGEAQPESAEGQPGGRPDEPAAYSLREPVVLPASLEQEARARLDAFTERLGHALRQSFDSEVSLALEGFQQQRAEAAIAVLEKPAWILPFRRTGKGRLAVVLSPKLALVVMELALGGLGAAPGEGRGPTPLEQRVLGRLQNRLSEALGTEEESFSPCIPGFGEVPASFAPAGETVCVGILRFKLGTVDQKGLLLATGPLLVPKASQTEALPARLGPLAAPLDEVPLPARPVLTAGRLSMKDLVEMKEGAVLRLDAPQGTALELRVAGESLFRGHIRRAEGTSGFAVTARKGRAPNEAVEETS